LSAKGAMMPWGKYGMVPWGKYGMMPWGKYGKFRKTTIFIVRKQRPA